MTESHHPKKRMNPVADKAAALSLIKDLASHVHDPRVGLISDVEVRELIASAYHDPLEDEIS